MDPITITVSVISAVAGILTTYKTGREYYQKYRAKKKAKKAAEAEVEDSLEVGATQIGNHCTQLSRRHGRAFEYGDDESRASLLGISLDLNRSLVDVLKSSLLSGRLEIIEPQQLWTASEHAQKRTIGAMIDLAQRVEASAPIPRLLSHPHRVNGAPNNLIMLHPASSQATTARRVVPALAIETPPLSSTSDANSTLSLQLSSFTRQLSSMSSVSASSSLNTPFQSSPLLLPTVFPNTDNKTTSDLLREWKDDLNARSPLLLSPNSPATTNSPIPRGDIKRYASAPSTPSLDIVSFHANRSSVRSPQLSPSTSGPALGLGIQVSGGNRMSSHRVQSNSSMPSSLTSSTEADFPSTTLHRGFTYPLPSTDNTWDRSKKNG